jgi:simple sugar transport system substrate-binding protein
MKNRIRKAILRAVAGTAVIALVIIFTTGCGNTHTEPEIARLTRATEQTTDLEEEKSETIVTEQITTAALTTTATTTVTAKPPEDDKIVVGIINNPPSESGYREKNVRDFEAVFHSENGYEAKTFYSLSNDEQIEAAEIFIAEGVDYLLISAASSYGWDDVLSSAKEAGIKVILFDRMIDTDESNYEAAVVTDLANQGEIAVDWLLAQNLSEYNVVHIQGAWGSDAQIGRSGALDEQFASGNMYKVVQTSIYWDESDAKSIMESVINSGEKFNVIYAENDGMARGAVAALDEAGISHGKDGDVIIISFDCNKWALREVLEGNWNCNVPNSPLQAKDVHILIKILERGETLTEKIINPEVKVCDAATITQEDVDMFGIGE